MTALLLLSLAVNTPTDAKKILDNIDDMYRGASSRGTMAMKVQTENWTRELTLEFHSKGEERSLIRILAPTKEKGTATLKVEKDIWNYLPKTARVIKVPSSMMGGSWMGSHFTNDDLVRDSRMANDFTYAVSFEGARDGDNVVEITCVPRADAAVVWGKVVVEVRQKDHQPLRIRYFDEDQQLARTMVFSDYKTIGKRQVPMVQKVVPADKPNESTEVRYVDVSFDIALDDNFFSLRELQR